MKLILLFSIFLYTFTLPALGELTQQDLKNIRGLLLEEIKPIKDDIATLKADITTLKTEMGWVRGKLEGVDKQFGSVEKQISYAINLTYGLIALIVVAVGIPQLILTWRSSKDREQERINQDLRQEIEKLKQQRIVNPMQ